MQARTSLSLLLATACLLIAATGREATAAAPRTRTGPVLSDTVLAQIPDDAAFFAAALRTSEHLDALRKSAAYRTLKKAPAYLLVMDLLRRALEDRGLPADLLDRVFSDQKREANERNENEELIDLLLEGAGDEVFVYGGKGWAELAALLRRMTGAGLSGGAETVVVGKFNFFDAFDVAGKRASRELRKSKESLRVPELVIGLRTRDAKKVAGHVARLEKELLPLLAFDQRLAGKLKRTGGMLTLEVDGSLVPWDELAFPSGEKNAIDDVVAHLRQATLCVSIGVRGDYALFAIGTSAKDLDRLGKGESLAGRRELRPLAGHEAKKVAAVAYVSEALREAVLGAPDWDAAAKSLGILVANNVKDEQTRKTAEADVAGVLGVMKKRSGRQGAWSAYVARTEAAVEAFAHDFGDHSRRRGEKTTLFDSVGGDPLFAAATNLGDGIAAYAALSKHVWSLQRQLEAAFEKTEMDDDVRQAYQKQVAALLPSLRKLDEAVTKHLAAGLPERTEAAFVVDAKWTSDRWHTSLPKTKRPLPMAEPAFVLGVRDRDSFTRGMQQTPLAFIDLYDRLRQQKQFAELPDLKWREAKTVTTVRRGDLYAYPNVFANGGLDEQVEATAAVGKRVAVLSLSQEQALTLLATKQPRLEAGPLRANKDRLLGGLVLDVPGLLDMLLVWADAAPELIKGEETVSSAVKQVAANLRGVAEVLRCVGQVQGATYLEGGVKTTRLCVPMRDLDVTPEPRRR